MYLNVWRLDIRACYVEKRMNLTENLYEVTFRVLMGASQGFHCGQHYMGIYSWLKMDDGLELSCPLSSSLAMALCPDSNLEARKKGRELRRIVMSVNREHPKMMYWWIGMSQAPS